MDILAQTSIDYGMSHRTELEAFAGQRITPSDLRAFIPYSQPPTQAVKLEGGRYLVILSLEVRSVVYLFADRAAMEAYKRERLYGEADPETGRR